MLVHIGIMRCVIGTWMAQVASMFVCVYISIWWWLYGMLGFVVCFVHYWLCLIRVCFTACYGVTHMRVRGLTYYVFMQSWCMCGPGFVHKFAVCDRFRVGSLLGQVVNQECFMYGLCCVLV